MPQSVRCKEYSTLCSPNQCSIQATKTNFILACYKIIQPNPNSELIQPNLNNEFYKQYKQIYKLNKQSQQMYK